MRHVSREIYTTLRDPKGDLYRLVLAMMDEKEMADRVAGVDYCHINDCPDELKTKLYLTFPSSRPHIDIKKLSPTFRTAIVCRLRTDELLAEFDVNAKDITIEHHRHMISVENKKIFSFLYKNISDENLKKFNANDWRAMLKVLPRSAKKLDIRSIRNPTELRRLILSWPRILKHSTLEQMKESVIDGATWVRMVARIPEPLRKYVPLGFKEWAEREIFRLGLNGRKFKKFGKWSSGLRTE